MVSSHAGTDITICYKEIKHVSLLLSICHSFKAVIAGAIVSTALITKQQFRYL